MAQNVGTPSFFVDIPTFENSLGHTGWASNQSDFIGLNPTNTTALTMGNYTYTFLRETDIDSVFFLGHDFFTNSTAITMSDDAGDLAPIGIINYEASTGGQLLSPEYDGFSYLSKSTESLSITIGLVAGGSFNLGAICLSKKYDMPHSPDLNLKLSYIHDGVRSITTKGGTTLSNATYTKPADWGEYGAWQLGNKQNYRSGRRVWDLSFSYLSDTDVMPNLGVQNYETNLDGTIVDTEDILTGTDFFSQVWNKTMGGHLPFIFQPDGGDSSTNSPDGFAICRFDMNSLTYDQVANNVYNVKLKIRECW